MTVVILQYLSNTYVTVMCETDVSFWRSYQWISSYCCAQKPACQSIMSVNVFLDEVTNLCVCVCVCITGSRVAVSELPDAEGFGNGHDHAALQEPAADPLSFPPSQT